MSRVHVTCLFGPSLSIGSFPEAIVFVALLGNVLQRPFVRAYNVRQSER